MNLPPVHLSILGLVRASSDSGSMRQEFTERRIGDRLRCQQPSGSLSMTSQTCHRIDLAREQLEMALDAFLQRHRFASAITLASAAERVLGQALRHDGKKAVLDWKFEATDLVHTDLHGKALDEGNFTAAESRVSNALRNFDKTDAPDFEADLEEAACWMLVRACENAHRLGLTVQGFDTFNEWFYKRVVDV
jgi:hypothetical protein